MKSGKSVKPGKSRPDAERRAWLRRVAGLAPGIQHLLEKASAGIRNRQLPEARRALVSAMVLAPAHPEVLRLDGVLCHLEGRYGQAIESLEAALAALPEDALILNNLGSSLRGAGRMDEAVSAFRRATERAPGLAAAWFNLGKTLKAQASISDAKVALQRALDIAPRHLAARIVLGDVNKAIGDIPAAAAAYRQAIEMDPRAAQAWFSLANLKTVRFTDSERAQLMALKRQGGFSPDDRVALGFSLVKALEDDGQHEAAFAELCDANARKREHVVWDAKAHAARVDGMLSVFAGLPNLPEQGNRGQEVIFVVSLPRSGSTLTEQILSAHPEVEGASELPDLPMLIEEESRLRGRPFPQWVADADDADWQRLGNAYLQRTRRWHEQRPRFTDKGLANWLYVGAAVRMLPGARFVVCQRDPLETCLSCFHQLFARGQEYSYEINDMAAYWHDFDRLCRFWREQYANQVHVIRYEGLIADPEGTTRELLSACDLAYDPACLRFHESRRIVRTASAAQVRTPLRQNLARAHRYGDALTPLRQALGRYCKD